MNESVARELSFKICECLIVESGTFSQLSCNSFPV